MSTSLFVAALEFTSLSMLGWLAAALLPWLIHRWQRRQHQTTRWAAVELLLTAMQQRTRTIHMQQWLLLIVRTAILICVALAAAEPTFRQWAFGAGGSTQVHRILVIDQSYSMGAEHEGVTRWQRALAYARQWIEGSSGDAITIVGWSAEPENLTGRPTFDTSVALAALDDLQLSQTSVELPAAARAVLAAIERAKTELPQIASHQVLFCTDLGRNTWQTDAGERQLLEQLSEQAQVTVINVGEVGQANIAITDLAVEPALALPQRETVITATLARFGDAGRSAVNLELLVDGRSVGRQQVELSSGDTTYAQFAHRFIDPGAHAVQVRMVDAGDALAIDDTRWLTVDVRPHLRVACFAGEAGAADDLTRALAPGRRLEDVASVVQPEVFSINRLSEIALSDYAAVMLCSVAELSPRESAVITKYVQQGGGLAIYLGSRTAPETFDGLSDVLPVRVKQLSPLGQYRFDAGEYRHPIVSPFRGQSQAGLLGVTISQYAQLQPIDKHLPAEVVLAFEQGDPALVVGQFGLGRVAVSALPGSLKARTTLGAPWSSFVLSPSFLPVVREMITYLVGDRWLQQRNLAVGQPAIFARDAEAGSVGVSVQLPDGVRQQLPLPSAEEGDQIAFSGTDASGVYRFRAGDEELARFAVNLNGRDADLASIAVDELPPGFTINRAAGPVPLPIAVTDFSFVRLFLACALMLLLVEIGLAYLIGKGWG